MEERTRIGGPLRTVSRLYRGSHQPASDGESRPPAWRGSAERESEWRFRQTSHANSSHHLAVSGSAAALAEQVGPDMEARPRQRLSSE